MSAPVNVNPSPRVRFQAIKGAIEAHRALLETTSFERGVDMAAMEYQRLVAEQIRDGNSAMAAGFKLQGMLEFVQTLKTLAEAAPVIVKRSDLDNLPPVDGLKRAN